MEKLKMQNHNLKYKSDLTNRCYKFSLELIKFINSLPSNRVVWVVSDQVLRSGMSVGANLVESKASSSRREFKKFYEISLKSANETKYWLSIIKDANLSKDSSQLMFLLSEIDEICKMLASGVLRLKGKKL